MTTTEPTPETTAPEPTWHGHTADDLVKLADAAADAADDAVMIGDETAQHRNDLRAILLRERATNLVRHGRGVTDAQLAEEAREAGGTAP